MKLLFAGKLSHKNANQDTNKKIHNRKQELYDNFRSGNRVKEKNALSYINLFV